MPNSKCSPEDYFKFWPDLALERFIEQMNSAVLFYEQEIAENKQADLIVETNMHKVYMVQKNQSIKLARWIKDRRMGMGYVPPPPPEEILLF